MTTPAFCHRRSLATAAALAVLAWLAVPRALAQVALDDEFGRQASWKIPTVGEVRGQVAGWLDSQKLDPALRKQADALWSADLPPTQLLAQTVATIALVDRTAQPLVERCGQPHGIAKTPEYAWLDDDETPALVRNNLRLWFGKWLTEERLYEEAMVQLNDLTPGDVVDPAALLFYQSVCHHWLLQKSEGLATVGKLLEQRKAIPRRYEQLADLMQADLADLQDESLDHISRRMNDVARRLDYGRAGQQVRSEEDGIIKSLDKMIQQLQDLADQMNANRQRQAGRDQDQQGGRRRVAGDPQGEQSRSPAAESTAARAHGAGQVKSKNIGNQSGWGDLPPKDREEALQQIGKEFPSHYRDVIEQYFRKLASEEEEK